MNALLVALGIMVLALLALMLWFVPHLLHQQAGETTRLREMLLDLLNEQEAVMVRQSQLSTSLLQLRDQIEVVAKHGVRSINAPVNNEGFVQLEARLSELQSQLQQWADQRQQLSPEQIAHDNESWAYLVSLLSVIQERVGDLSRDRSNALAGVQARILVDELEQEMAHLRGISEDISKLQWRLRQSLHEREVGLANLRSFTGESAS